MKSNTKSSPAQYEFFVYTPDLSKEWDDFVLSHPSGSIHQVSDWKTLQEKIPGREEVLGFGVKQKGKIVAATWCVKMQTGSFNTFWYYSPRGPVMDFKNTQLVDFFISSAKKELQKTKAMFWRVDPYTFSDLPYGKTATQDYQPTDTLEIDLTKTDEEILSEMKRKGRYNINLARKNGVEVEILAPSKIVLKDIDDFWALTTETTGRDGFSGHEKNYYELFLHSLQKYAVLFFATKDGKRIATAISTFCGEKSIYYFGASASNPEYRNLMAPYLLQWEMMQYAKKRGCKTYDFLGIAPEDQPDHKYAGISEFKWKFGGYRKTYAPGREIVLSSFWYGLYRAVKKLRR